jgi:hypothetical protein
MFLVEFIEDRWHKDEGGGTVTHTKTAINPEIVQKVTESEGGKTAIMVAGGLSFTVYGSFEEVVQKLRDGSTLLYLESSQLTVE